HTRPSARASTLPVPPWPETSGEGVIPWVTAPGVGYGRGRRRRALGQAVAIALGAARSRHAGRRSVPSEPGPEAPPGGREIGLEAMARRRRAPFQVLVFPYRRRPDAELEVALFRRVDGGYWQGIAGGGHEGETPEDAARRETREEAGIEPTGPWIAL